MFCKMSLLGPLLGLAFGILMTMALKRIHNQPIMEANITVCFPYIAFYVAEHHNVHVSGILALVAMGLFMTRSGKTTAISTESEESIHAIWSYIGFAAETLIFALTGLILGGEMVRDGVKLIWIPQLFAMYIGLHIIRFLGLAMLYPCMKLTGYSYSWKHVILLSYSGLRGAVGLCLALMIKFDDNIDVLVRDQVMFFTGGIVLLTLLINGTTTGYVIRKLGLAKENEMSKVMLKKVLESHDSKAEKFIAEWKKERAQAAGYGANNFLYEDSILFG